MKAAIFCAVVLLVLTLAGGAAIVALDIHHVLTQTSVTINHFGIVAAKVSTAADTVNAAAGEERANWQKTSTEAAKTGLALRELIDDLRKSSLHVNLVTLPAIDQQIAANGDQLQATLGKLGGSADGVTAVAGALNTRLDDPEIAALLGH